MSREYPDWLDPRKAADGRRSFVGTMPLKRMNRLLPLLAESGGEARFTVSFAFDAQARVTISIEVEALLPLICQRSLECYQQVVNRNSLLGVIEEIEEESLLPGNYEPVLVENRRLALLDLVEDELLLGMPQVPTKPDSELVESAEFEEGTSEVLIEKEPVKQPFAGLAEQMKIHAQAKKKSG